MRDKEFVDICFGVYDYGSLVEIECEVEYVFYGCKFVGLVFDGVVFFVIC